MGFNDRASASDSCTVTLERDESSMLFKHRGKYYRRIGQCNRCGECCKSGDPFSQRGERDKPCTYYDESDGEGICLARLMEDPPEKVLWYLKHACFEWPTRPYDPSPYPRCGYRWEPVSGS